MRDWIRLTEIRHGMTAGHTPSGIGCQQREERVHSAQRSVGQHHQIVDAKRLLDPTSHVWGGRPLDLQTIG